MTFEEIGYKKVMKNNKGAVYERKIPEYNAIVRISIIRRVGTRKVIKYPSRRYEGAIESHISVLTLCEEMARATIIEEWWINENKEWLNDIRRGITKRDKVTDTMESGFSYRDSR